MRTVLPKLNLGLTVAALLLVFQPHEAGAEWLVLVDGSRLEIKEGFEAKGRQAVFELTNGTLSMMPLDEIDIEATRSVNAPPEPSEPKAAPVPKRSGVVLNNQNVRLAAPVAAAAASGDAGTAGSAAAAPAASTKPQPKAASPLQVTSWEDRTTAESTGASFEGVLSNPTNGPFGGIRLTVHLVDADGKRSSSTAARVNINALGAGQTTDFRAEFPGEFSYQTLKFEIHADGFTFGAGGRAKIKRDLEL